MSVLSEAEAGRMTESFEVSFGSPFDRLRVTLPLTAQDGTGSGIKRIACVRRGGSRPMR